MYNLKFKLLLTTQQTCSIGTSYV